MACSADFAGTSPVPMSILTRSGVAGRDHTFGPMRESVLSQDYPNVHHLISTQNVGCRYLPPWRAEAASPCGVQTTIVQARLSSEIHRQFTTDTVLGGPQKYCPYDKFILDLLDWVDNSSWIMIVDDDALIASPHHVSDVMRIASRAKKNTFILQPSTVGNKLSRNSPTHYDGKTIWPMRDWRDGKTLTPFGMRVDMSNLVFHKSMVKHIHIGMVCNSDKMIFGQIMKHGRGRLHVMNASTTGVGIFANYLGAARGSTMLGYRWRDVGEQRPQGGSELQSSRLTALLTQGVTDLSRAQLQTLKLAGIRRDHFVRAGSHYFQPAEAAAGAALEPPATGCTDHSKRPG